jgi:hypothetical protein
MVDINRNETSDVTTFREVSMALKAINDRLDLMQKVFHNERFNGIDKRLDEIKAMIGTRQQGQLEGPTPTKLPFKYDPAADVFPDWVGIEGDPNKAPIDWKAMGVEKPTGKFWIFNPK